MHADTLATQRVLTSGIKNFVAMSDNAQVRLMSSVDIYMVQT